MWESAETYRVNFCHQSPESGPWVVSHEAERPRGLEIANSTLAEAKDMA